MLSLQDQAAHDRWERLYQDPDYDMALHRYRKPARCSACGSIENNGERCSWCRNELEVS